MASTTTAAADQVVNEQANSSVKTPLAAPAETAKVPPRPHLSAQEEEKYNWVLEQVKGWTEIEGKKAGPITDEERFWLTRECLLRYLRASKWKQEDAVKRLMATLVWRREYGVKDVATAENVSIEGETGKQFLLGYDIYGRPVHLMNPGRQNTEHSPRQLHHLVYLLERAIDLMPPGQETLCLIIDFSPSKTRSNTTPPLSQSKETLNILQNHYPERLGRSLQINLPWYANAFFKLITPFIDPNTREKLKFNEDLTLYVPKEQLWKQHKGGELDFDYEHSIYWPALKELAQQRRDERWQRWVDAGKLVGESEDYLSGAKVESVGGPRPTEAQGEANVAEKAPEAPTPAVEDLKVADLAINEKAATVEEGSEAPKPVAA